MTTRRRRDERQTRDRIARSIFAALERSGVADRGRAEAIVQRVFQRLEGMQPFPGMDDVLPRPVREPTPDEIMSIVQEVIMAQTQTQAPDATSPVPLSKGDHGGSDTAQLKPPALSGGKPSMTETSRRPDLAPPFTAGSPGNGKEPAFPSLLPNAIAVLEKRYLKKDSEGRIIETIDGMFHRVARNIAQADLRYDPQADLQATEEEFYRLMRRLDFLPNSPTLMNAGRELQQLSACFVLPVEDSTEKIFDAVKYTALIHKSGGGTGFSFSRLRPKQDRVGSTGGIASGPVSFMRAFDTATEVIKQGGMRRGANMAILRVDHPDIEDFITAKADMVSLQNFNISVAVTEDFMKRAEAGEEYDLINPRIGKPQGRLNARAVLQMIVDMAWKNGDPGLVFIDRINAANPTPNLGPIESTNPCGEQPLLPYESCNLGSINLAAMLTESGGGGRVVDWDKLEKTVRLAVHFLDNVIDMNRYPLPQIADMTLSNRKIGLGVMGFADMLILLGTPYDSELAPEMAEKVMKFIAEKADQASADLGQARGVFPSFEGSIYDRPGAPRVRNATRTTIAPTGTLSIVAGCSSGIEPLYALSFVRNILDKAQLVEVNPYFEDVARREGFWSETLMQELAQRGSVRAMKDVPEGVQRLFVTAHDIAPEWHVRMQAAFQRYTDNAVSKTVNFPSTATVDDVARVYQMAYREGCKGITIYRDQSREQQVLTTKHVLREGEGKEERKEAPVPVSSGRQPRARPTETRGTTRKVATGCGSLYVTVNSDEEGLAEVFTSLGKAGGCASAQMEAASRLISLALRSGVDVEAIVKQLKGIRCPSIAWEGGHATLSCADAVASVLERYLEGAPAASDARHASDEHGNAAPAPLMETPRNLAGQCPECSSLLIYQEGCYVCHFCGYTKCS